MNEQIPLPAFAETEDAIRQRNDEARLRFLTKLHAAALCPTSVSYQPGVFHLGEWEKHFVEDLVREPRGLTASQRSMIDTLRERFQDKL